MIIEKYSSILFFLLIILSCERDSEESIDIQGCIDETACNYDSSATIDDGGCVFADQYCNSDCDYTHFESLPSSLTILSGDSCLYNADISVLDSIIRLNSLEYDSPLEVGTQTWYNGRLRFLVAGNYGNSSGVNDTIYFLPDNIGNWTELVSLYLEWNRISVLPDSFSELTSLINLYLNNNVLSSLPDNLENLENLYFLDLGYNYRMTDIQAAIGRVQLKRLNELINRRREIAHNYYKLLKNNEEIISNMIEVKGRGAYIIGIASKNHFVWHRHPLARRMN